MAVFHADLPSVVVKPAMHIVMSTVANGANNAAITGIDLH